MTAARPAAITTAAVLSALLFAATDARASFALGGAPSNPPVVVLEGELADRCAEWAKGFEASEAARARDLGLTDEELAPWAKERGTKARTVCGQIALPDVTRWPKGRAITDADLGLPPGFLARLQIGEPDLQTWQKAASSGAERIYPSDPKRKEFLEDRAKSGCSRESGAVRTEGRWVWCRTAAFDSMNYDPLEHFKRAAIRAAAIGAGVIVLVGFVALLALGRKSAKAGARPPRGK